MRSATCSLLLAALALPAAARSQDLTRDDVKRLLPRAIGMSAEDWHAITRAPEPPTLYSFREMRLTSSFLLSRWAPDTREDAVLRFLRDDVPSPAEIAPSLERSLPEGFVSFVQADDLGDIVISNPKGPETSGTCTFELEGFFRGTLHFTARRGDSGWEIVSAELPGPGVRSRLRNGKWVGSEALLGGQWLRRELGLAFRLPEVDREEFESWKRPDARPVLTELADQRPGAAIVARPVRPTASSWRFLGETADGRPSLDAIERLVDARDRLTHFATLVAPEDVTRVLFDDPRGPPNPPIVSEVLSPELIKRASGTFELRVDGLMEGEGRFEARYVSPAHLPEWFEGAWILQRIELPGLGWAFERGDDFESWRASSLR